MCNSGKGQTQAALALVLYRYQKTGAVKALGPSFESPSYRGRLDCQFSGKGLLRGVLSHKKRVNRRRKAAVFRAQTADSRPMPLTLHDAEPEGFPAISRLVSEAPPPDQSPSTPIS